MNTKKFDIIEAVLKKDLKIPLTEDEEKWLNHIDDQIKADVLELVNNSAFLDEIKRVSEHIIKTSCFLTSEEQEYVKNKCDERIRNLEHPSLTSKSFGKTSR